MPRRNMGSGVAWLALSIPLITMRWGAQTINDILTNVNMTRPWMPRWYGTGNTFPIAVQ